MEIDAGGVGSISLKLSPDLFASSKIKKKANY